VPGGILLKFSLNPHLKRRNVRGFHAKCVKPTRMEGEACNPLEPGFGAGPPVGYASRKNVQGGPNFIRGAESPKCYSPGWRERSERRPG